MAQMPFDNELYDGIFSYALIHLLNADEREKFIKDCYNQLKVGGYMIFTAISKKAPMFGQGIQLSKNYYEMPYGVNLFFYDEESVQEEFGKYGLVEFSEIEEGDKEKKNKPTMKFLMIKCKKEL